MSDQEVDPSEGNQQRNVSPEKIVKLWNQFLELKIGMVQL